MELYESLFIIRPSVSDEETKTLIDKMKNVADKTGAEFIKAENLGRKSSPTKCVASGRGPTPISTLRRRTTPSVNSNGRIDWKTTSSNF